MGNKSRADEFVDVFDQSQDEASISFVDRTLANLADEHSDVVVISADLGNSLAEFKDRHPERYIEVGIAETNAISVAAGLAAVGMRPYVLAFAPFGLIKCAEQIRTDLAVTEMPVVIITRLSGLAMGYFGASHHAIEDLAIGRAINNLTLAAPSDGLSTKALIDWSYEAKRPTVIRVSEGTSTVYAEEPEISLGQVNEIRPGVDAAILATGLGVNWATRAAGLLSESGIEAAVYDVTFLKPFNSESIVDICRRHNAVVTVEEHVKVGGLYSAVAEAIAGESTSAVVRSVSIPEEHLEVGTHTELLEHYGLTGEGVAQVVRTLVNETTNGNV